MKVEGKAGGMEKEDVTGGARKEMEGRQGNAAAADRIEGENGVEGGNRDEGDNAEKDQNEEKSEIEGLSHGLLIYFHGGAT